MRNAVTLRKFREAIVADSESSIAGTARDFCDKLFAIESDLDKLITKERSNERLVQEKPVLLYISALAFAPFGVSQNNQFLRPTVNGRMAF